MLVYTINLLQAFNVIFGLKLSVRSEFPTVPHQRLAQVTDLLQLALRGQGTE